MKMITYERALFATIAMTTLFHSTNNLYGFPDFTRLDVTRKPVTPVEVTPVTYSCDEVCSEDDDFCCYFDAKNRFHDYHEHDNSDFADDDQFYADDSLAHDDYCSIYSGLDSYCSSHNHLDNPEISNDLEPEETEKEGNSESETEKENSESTSVDHKFEDKEASTRFREYLSKLLNAGIISNTTELREVLSGGAEEIFRSDDMLWYENELNKRNNQQEVGIVTMDINKDLYNLETDEKLSKIKEVTALPLSYDYCFLKETTQDKHFKPPKSVLLNFQEKQEEPLESCRDNEVTALQPRVFITGKLEDLAPRTMLYLHDEGEETEERDEFEDLQKDYDSNDDEQEIDLEFFDNDEEWQNILA